MVKPADDIALETLGAEAAPSLFALLRASIHGLAARHYTPAQLVAWAPDDGDLPAFAGRLAGTAIIAARRGAMLAGFANLAPDGLVDFLFVHPDAAGRGIGPRLLAAAIAAGRAQGMAQLSAHVSLTARPTFEAAGFAVEAEQQVPLSGEVLTNFRMRLAL
ncbi:GNAT family N-acetyltransferase [Zavarzinia compransoris]|uniref:GNAT family N-acetyltransferase n=1 Tax=Zavarzinia compransoris TaxID=1264899 RepID=UPI0010D4DA63|nr:GNAT family N-acetyltransferase [Zavarzinia compransoris]TDP46142.1 GNAT family acetyltransferase [Zavarzinia compransoris]